MSDENQGSGVLDSNASPRSASGLTSIREARLTRRAIQRGWITGQRWPTDATQAQIEDAAKERPLTLKEKTALAAFDGLECEDTRVRSISVSSVVAMERMVQKDDLFADASEALTDPVPQGDVNINIQQNVVAGSISPADELRSLISSVVPQRPAKPGTNGNGSNGHT